MERSDLPTFDPDRPGTPQVAAVLTMFYYRDIDSAAAWYAETIGLEPLMAGEGFMLFAIAEGAQLALVGSGHGSQTPIDGRNKGAILSIQTDDLQGWHARLFAKGVEGTGAGVQVGGGGRTLEFKVHDPEGYTIEFFEWL